MATAEFSKFAGVLSAALSQHHLSGFEIAQINLPVHRQLPGFTQTHVHRVGDAIQPSHPLLSPFPPDFNLQHQGLFQ